MVGLDVDMREDEEDEGRWQHCARTCACAGWNHDGGAAGGDDFGSIGTRMNEWTGCACGTTTSIIPTTTTTTTSRT